jgi:hypothetical protein
VPYTLFVYGAGFSLGPSVAELHADKSLAFIINFLPSLAIVTVVVLGLVSVGIRVINKAFGARVGIFCLNGLLIPMLGTAAYSLTPNGTYNVRYTIIAFPFFCLLAGTALEFLTCARKRLGLFIFVALISISASSFYNRLTNARYANEDIRSAVNFWRQAGGKEPLLAIGSMDPTRRYVGGSQEQRLFLVGNSTTDMQHRIQKVLALQNISSAYVVVARDWNRRAEIAIRNAFQGTLEGSFPGVKVFRILRPRTLQVSDASPMPAASGY